MENLVDFFNITQEEAEEVDNLIIQLTDNMLGYMKEAITIYLEAKALEEMHN